MPRTYRFLDRKERELYLSAISVKLVPIRSLECSRVNKETHTNMFTNNFFWPRDCHKCLPEPCAWDHYISRIMPFKVQSRTHTAINKVQNFLPVMNKKCEIGEHERCLSSHSDLQRTERRVGTGQKKYPSWKWRRLSAGGRPVFSGLQRIREYPCREVRGTERARHGRIFEFPKERSERKFRFFVRTER